MKLTAEQIKGIKKIKEFGMMISISTIDGYYPLDLDTILFIVENGLDAYEAKLAGITIEEYIEVRKDIKENRLRRGFRCTGTTNKNERCKGYSRDFNTNLALMEPKKYLLAKKTGIIKCPVHKE